MAKKSYNKFIVKEFQYCYGLLRPAQYKLLTITIKQMCHPELVEEWLNLLSISLLVWLK